MKPWPGPKDKTQQSSAPDKGTTYDTSSAQDEKEAQFHYKVALTALKNKDFNVATRELQIAARLAPKNALVQYDLAVVKSQSGNPTDALTYLKRAIDLGTLPDEQAKDAERRLVDLTYASERFSWLIGSWRATFAARVSLPTPAAYSHSCSYEGPGEFKMNVSKADDQSDALSGEILFKAESAKFKDGPTSYCRKEYGQDDQEGSVTYRISDVEILSGPYKGWVRIYGTRTDVILWEGGTFGFYDTGQNTERDLTGPNYRSIWFNARRDQDRLQTNSGDWCDCVPRSLEKDN
jgi:hypothetical protein